MKFLKGIAMAMFLLALTFAMVAQAVAEEGESFLSAPWKFHVNLYGWLPEAPATLSVDDRELVDAPEDLDTVLDSLDAAAMFELEVHKGPVFVFANTFYYDGEYDENFRGPVSGQPRKFSFQEEAWVIKYGAGYRLGPWNLGKSKDSPTLALYPWAGALYFHDDYELKIDPAAGRPGEKSNGTIEFNTPMVGLATLWDLSERWYLNLSYGYGGWDVDHVNDTYDFVGNIGYRFEMWGVSSKIFAGYRYLHIDYQKQSIEIDVDVKGPLLGIGWEF